MLLYIFSCLFLYLSYKSKNPLSCALFIILALATVGPYLLTVIPSWCLYIFFMLFIGGVFVLLVYVTTLAFGKEGFVYLSLTIMFVLLVLILTPLVVSSYYGIVSTISMLYEHEYSWLEFIVLVLLSKTLFFIGYILVSCGAMRKW